MTRQKSRHICLEIERSLGNRQRRSALGREHGREHEAIGALEPEVPAPDLTAASHAKATVNSLSVSDMFRPCYRPSGYLPSGGRGPGEASGPVYLRTCSPAVPSAR